MDTLKDDLAVIDNLTAALRTPNNMDAIATALTAFNKCAQFRNNNRAALFPATHITTALRVMGMRSPKAMLSWIDDARLTDSELGANAITPLLEMDWPAQAKAKLMHRVAVAQFAKPNDRAAAVLRAEIAETALIEAEKISKGSMGLPSVRELLVTHLTNTAAHGAETIRTSACTLAAKLFCGPAQKWDADSRLALFIISGGEQRSEAEELAKKWLFKAATCDRPDITLKQWHELAGNAVGGFRVTETRCQIAAIHTELFTQGAYAGQPLTAKETVDFLERMNVRLRSEDYVPYTLPAYLHAIDHVADTLAQDTRNQRDLLGACMTADVGVGDRAKRKALDIALAPQTHISQARALIGLVDSNSRSSATPLAAEAFRLDALATSHRDDAEFAQILAAERALRQAAAVALAPKLSRKKKDAPAP